jgi:hypothetical protein
MANALREAKAGCSRADSLMSIHPADLLSLSPLLKLGEGIPRHPD